jgi:hypothetical protein
LTAAAAIVRIVAADVGTDPAAAAQIATTLEAGPAIVRVGQRVDARLGTEHAITRLDAFVVVARQTQAATDVAARLPAIEADTF